MHKLQWNKKRVWVCLCVVLAGLYVWQFVRVNSAFPQGDYIKVAAHDIVSYNGMEYQAEGYELISAEEYGERYGNYDLFTQGATVLVAELSIRNTTQKEKSGNISELIAIKGNWSNGADMFALWDLNGTEFDGKIQAGEVKHIKVAFEVNTDVKALEQKNTSWMVRLSGWPCRREMILGDV